MTNEEAIKIFKEVREEVIAKETELSRQVFENLGIKAIDVAIKALEQARPNGKWKRISPAGIYECTNCNQVIMTSDINCYKYCHGCGVRMEGEE